MRGRPPHVVFRPSRLGILVPRPTHVPAQPGHDYSHEAKRMERIFVVIGSISAFLGVALGAFGAHGLEGRLEPADLNTFEIAVRYQMYHALALLFLGLALGRWPGSLGVWAGWGFVSGSLIFSGSLYALVFTGVRGLGAVTPIGGLALLAGWALAALHLMRSS